MTFINVRTKGSALFIEKPLPRITSGGRKCVTLRVEFDETWVCGDGKYFALFYVDNPDNGYTCELNKVGTVYECLVPDSITANEGIFNFGVWCESAEDEVIPSDIKTMRVNRGAIQQSSSNEVDIAVNSAKEEYRSELETSIETATGENHDNKTWEELNNTVATLPIISEEQTQALGDYDLVKEYFANYIGGWHDLFRGPPRDETGTGIEYRLPYIYTPKMKWAEGNYISTDLLEFGVDVSSAINLSGDNSGTFHPLPKLQRLTLTGNENNPSCRLFMYKNSALRYLKMDTPSEVVLKANPSYYDRAFHTCTSLQTIDCEFDFSYQTNTAGMFDGCTSLKDLRIKPFTLSTSLNLGSCMKLHNNDLLDYGSLISILNGITTDREVSKNITITFSTQITDFTQGMVQFWNCNVFFGGDSGLYYETPPKNEIYLELSLYEAFTSKGVTIAWKQ